MARPAPKGAPELNRILNDHLDAEELSRFGPIITMAPIEVEIGEEDAA